MAPMDSDGIEVRVEGDGAEAVVMIHGWPDTLRLWDSTVQALKPHWRCVRFTLPGFDLSRRDRAYSLDEVVQTVHRIVTRCCPGQRVTLLVHDWGCLFGYQFALCHPELVSRIVGVDIGDAGSKAHQAELGVKAKLMVLAYQLWLATAWRIGGALGDRMARRMAAAMRCPAEPQSIGAQMGYPYAVQWFGVKGGFGAVQPFEPAVPMLYLYGQRKPFMFHSQAWIEALARRPGSRVVGLRTGHWVMLNQPQEFNAEVARWLAETAAAIDR
jgi:cis-3-alkyl-4-acyloxetan-2-one decarboxylase